MIIKLDFAHKKNWYPKCVVLLILKFKRSKSNVFRFSAVHLLLLLSEIPPPYTGLLSSSCGGLQPLAAPEGPFRPPKDNFARQTDDQTDGQRV